MAEYATLLRLTLEVSQPVDELKVAIVKMAQMHPGEQLNIYKEIEMWLGKTIVDIEKQLTAANQAKEGAEKPAEQTST